MDRTIPSRFEEVTLLDAARLANLSRRLRSSSGPSRERLRRDLDQRTTQAREVLRRRCEASPAILFPKELPLSSAHDELTRAIREHQVVIVCGDTGSGKTTQLPKLLYEMGYGRRGRIGCTQPRRLAAVSMARRVAEEMTCTLGDTVGYQVRFDDSTKPETSIKFMTDGILLAELPRDRQWLQYDALIIDEVHERSLNIDFILGCLKRILQRRHDLKVVISSATLDAERFAAFFGGAPVIQVHGRRFPVEDVYFPPSSEEEELASHVGRAIAWLSEMDEQGDVLVFLPGEREIRETCDLLRGQRLPRTEILPLFARLSLHEQQRVFQPGRERRIVLATNVAETSITIPNIHYVVDSGWVRLKRYQPRLRIERLQIEMLSQASANQRRGRCGRIAEGICIRLYDREAFEQAEAYTPPEIQRDSLADVILAMKTTGLPDIEEFPFVDPPRLSLIREGYQTLIEIGALDEQRKLTARGRLIGRFRVDPRIARMIVQAHEEDCLPDLLAVAAGLSIQDPRERPAEKRQEAGKAQARWANASSDFLTLLNLWESWQELTSASQARKRAFCRTHYLNYRRMREWSNTFDELREASREQGWACKQDQRPARERHERLHRCILAGIPLQFGIREERHLYRGTGDKTFHLFPGSSLFGNPPEWLMAFELVETSRLYARQAAALDPAWVEQVAPHLCKAVYGNPYWKNPPGFVYAEKTVMCGGLPLLERRPVHYGPIDPDRAKPLFLREGLIPGNMRARGAWFAAYRKQLDDVHELEVRIRRIPGTLLDMHGLFERLDDLLPPSVHNTRALEQWTRKQHDLPPVTRQHMLGMQHEQYDPRLYPDSLAIEGIHFELRYRFEPGEPEDGACLICPAKWVYLLNEQLLSWGIPGWLEERVYVLLRTLIPRIRQKLNPLRHTAQRMAGMFLRETLEKGDWPPRPATLAEVLAHCLREELGDVIGTGDFDAARLPRWQHTNIEVRDSKGRCIIRTRTLEEARQAVDARSGHPGTPVQRGPLPDPLPPDHSGSTPRDEPVERFRQAHKDLIRFLERRLPFSQAIRLHLGLMNYAGDPLRDLIDGAILELASHADASDEWIREHLYTQIHEHIEHLERAVKHEEEALQRTASLPAHTAANTLDDLALQNAEIYASGTLRLSECMHDRVRWARARKIRVERACVNPAKDAEKLSPLLAARQHLHALLEATSTPLISPRLAQGIALFQEWRITVFAPEVGTRIKAAARTFEEWMNRANAPSRSGSRKGE